MLIRALVRMRIDAPIGTCKRHIVVLTYFVVLRDGRMCGRSNERDASWDDMAIFVSDCAD
jgi:hypothetical protein